MIIKLNLLLILLPIVIRAQFNNELQTLGYNFWKWRACIQPATMDDIPRIERPENWTPDYSSAALKSIDVSYKDFNNQLIHINKNNFTRSDSVDYLCIKSAIERVNWEFNILKLPQQNPDFYVQQTIGALYEILVQIKDWNDSSYKKLLNIINSIPLTIENAKQNLIEPNAPFALIAIDNLSDIKQKLDKLNSDIPGISHTALKNEFSISVSNAINSLEDYRLWLQTKLPLMKSKVSIGKNAYDYFLKRIALVPYTVEELINYARIEFNRASAAEEFEKIKNKNLPAPKVFSTIEDEINCAAANEVEIRNFITAKELFTIPDWLKNYTLSSTPAYLSPLTFIGESDDFTSESRLNENCVRYIVNPDISLPFFPRSLAIDPTPVIIHEGIPGHYFQLALSWKNENQLRRRFIDSGPNEGIAFYFEEMMLQMGFFDNRPYAREFIYKFMRLRALRVEADIQLALGNFSIDEAAKYLENYVPMDKESAISSAYFYAYNPGQAISYQLGKIQVIKFLNDAKRKLGDKFVLKNFHDYIVRNGNVPISLLRWEFLGLTDEVKQFFEN